MNEEHRDTEEVLVAIKKAAIFVDPFVKIASKGLIKMLQFLARMVKEKIIDKRDFKNFENFAKRTGGNFDVINIPIEQTGEKLERTGKHNDAIKEFEKLREQGARFYEMPDLNMNDNYIQIAVCRDDREIFSSWYERYLFNKLSGGEKTVDSLNAFTHGETQILSVPLEGKEEVFKDDFEALKINYAVLPDLKVGDGQIQLIVASNDLSRVEHWYQMYQQDRLKHGEQVPDMNVIDMSTYQKTAEMTTDEYIDTGDEKVKTANQKYENEKAGAYKIRLADDEKTYEDYEGDRRYLKFTINSDTLAEPLRKDDFLKNKITEWNEKGLFASRIPGTYGENVQYLLIPKERVFLSSDKKTYTAFIEKNEQPVILNKNFKLIGGTQQRPYATEVFNKYYKLSEKEQKATATAQNKTKQAAQKMNHEKKVKAPKPPLKSK